MIASTRSVVFHHGRTLAVLAAACMLAGTLAAAPAALAQEQFGIQGFSIAAQDDQGNQLTQAGAHPNVTATFTFNSHPVSCVANGEITTCQAPDGPTKDVEVRLPPGLIGDPQATQQCSPADLAVPPYLRSSCPSSTIVGYATVSGNIHINVNPATVPIYNVVPPPDEPALFAFNLSNEVTYITTSVRTGGDYGLTTTSANIAGPGAEGASTISLTFWGVPADHDGPGPIQTYPGGTIGGPGEDVRVPFLTNPTDCQSGPLTATLSADTWNDPGQYVSTTASLAAPTECDALSFDPSISMAPDTSQAGEPAGYAFELSLPQNENPDGLGTPELQDATVTLPAGVVVSPSEANGLEGCSDEQFADSSASPATCPEASQIGTVQVTTPLLSSPLEGQVYLGAPNCSPCTNTDAQDGQMLRLFLQAQGSGVLIKLEGTVSDDPSTGQLTATFDNNPQLPFSNLQLRFKGGPEGALANPSTCGAYTTTSDLSPWSGGAGGTPDATPSSTFEITGCGDPDQFSPTFSAGTVNPQAGARTRRSR